MSWVSIALLACAVLVLIGAEWPRLAGRASVAPRRRSGRVRPGRPRRRAHLRLLHAEEDDDFAASVQRDLERLPTIEERDGKR